MIKAIRPDFLWRFVLALILIGSVFRFLGLESVMPGFYTDESAISSQIICLRQTGMDYWGQTLPLVSYGAGDYTSPVHVYPAVLWTGIFGDSITSYRSFLAFFSVLTLLGLYQLANLLFRDRRAALLVALAYAVSPWSFQFARIAWNSGAAPCFLVWACFFVLRAEKRWHAIAAGSLFAFAMWAYAPTRLHAVFLVPFLMLVKLKREPGKRTWELAGIATLCALFLGLPLLQLTLQGGGFSERAKMLSIFSDYYLSQFGGFSISRVAQTFIENMGLFFKPSYLFWSGDANLRHSTQSFGILSWLDIFGLLLSVLAFNLKSMSKDERNILLFLIAGYIFGLVPAALTWESNPHSLRSLSAQPFVSLLTGWILYRCILKKPWSLHLTSIVAAASLAALIYVHFVIYPVRAREWFDTDIATYGRTPKSGQEWDQFMNAESNYARVSRAYFLMAYGSKVCIPETRRP